jgi:hypothetical protein
MSALRITMDWSIDLTTRELLLVLKGLGGRLRDDEIAEAKALGDRLSLLKGQQIDHHLRYNQKLLDKLEDVS